MSYELGALPPSRFACYGGTGRSFFYHERHEKHENGCYAMEPGSSVSGSVTLGTLSPSERVLKDEL